MRAVVLRGLLRPQHKMAQRHSNTSGVAVSEIPTAFLSRQEAANSRRTWGRSRRGRRRVFLRRNNSYSSLAPPHKRNLDAWPRLARGLDWEAELARGLEEAQARRVRLATHTGRPLAGDRFIAKIERRLGRRLRALPVGRPRARNR